MKFCMVTTFYPPYHFGGDATYAYRLSEALARRGHHVDVVHDRDAYYLAHPGEPSLPFTHHPNVAVHALKSRLGFLSPLVTQQTGYPWLKPDVRRLLERGGYDVIHYHNMSLIGPAALAYGDAIKLYTTHEHWLECPMHILWKFDREICTHKQCLRCTIRGGRPPQVWRYTGLLSRWLAHVDRLISPSRFTRDRHHEAGFDRPIAVLPYFVPNEEAPAESAPPPHSRPYFLFVGRLVKPKGLQTLIPMFRHYPAADLLVAGEGEFEPQLRALAAGVPGVTFLGPQSHAQLRALYRGAVALIMPSICYEVFGIVLIEAFAERTPVIARDLGGIPEAVTDSNGGLLFRTDEELRQAMHRLQEDSRLRRTLGENGHAACLRLWSEAAHLARYLEVIDEVADRKGRRVEARA